MIQLADFPISTALINLHYIKISEASQFVRIPLVIMKDLHYAFNKVKLTSCTKSQYTTINDLLFIDTPESKLPIKS